MMRDIRTRTTHRATAGLTALALLVAQIAWLPPAEAANLGSSTASAGSAPPPSISAIEGFQPDLFTGRATTGIPISVPPGRRGVQPALALGYSSSGQNGWLGVGWDLDLGAIERSTKFGVPSYDASDSFSFSFQGVSSELVRIPDGTYRAKDEGMFLHVADQGLEGWEVRDKSGTRYLFGGTPDSEQKTADGVFRWALRKVIDPNGNFLLITYSADQGRLYPSRIDYTGHLTGTVEDAAPTNAVMFTLEARPDPITSYRSGAPVTTAFRLKDIAAYAQEQLVRRYVLNYAVSQRTGRSLLESVTVFGSDDATSLPATGLTYQSETTPAYALVSNTAATGSPIWNVRAANMDTGHENNQPCNPFLGVPWSAPLTQSSGSIGSVSFSSGSDGSITISFPQDNFFHAWTWVYNTGPVSIGDFGYDVGCMWIEDAQGLRQTTYPGTVALGTGWTIIHLTGYHQHSGRTMPYSFGLKNAVTLMNPTQFSKPQLAGDPDGNGISDLIAYSPSSGSWTVSRSTGNAFSTEGTWLTGFGDSSHAPLVGDWNADALTDIAIYASGTWRFATSDGTAFQPDGIPSYAGSIGTPLTGDFNGDGMLDIGTYESGAWTVAMSSGNGFSPSGAFGLNWGTGSDEPLTGDFNGDGLTDIGLRNTGTGAVSVRFSTGSGFTAPAVWGSGLTADQVALGDANGDGLTDLLLFHRSTGTVTVARSTGTAFGAPAALPAEFSLRSSDDQLQAADFNGDGLIDPTVFNTISGNAEIAYSAGTFSDLLSGITNGLGGSTAITYQASTQCNNLCPLTGLPLLPFILPVVQRTAVSDGMGNTYETTYLYTQGAYEPVSREFRGFGRVEARDADGNVSMTEFHQDEHTKGRPESTEFRDAFDSLWTRTEQTWTCSHPYPGVHLAQLAQSDAYTFDGDATSRQVRNRFEYDQYGNVIKAYADGEASVSGDERSTSTTFTYNENAWILDKPALAQTQDGQGKILAQRRFYYDGASSTSAAPTAGNLTKEEEWLFPDPGDPGNPSGVWLATSLTYDATGSLSTITDALGRITTNSYDATRTFLTGIENQLGHARTLTYEPGTGQVLTSTDANGVLTATAYDPLGRPTSASITDPVTQTTTTLSTVSYDLSALPARTSATVYTQPGMGGALTTHQFTDGLGRVIQVRAPAEDLAKQVVTGTVEFNTRGQVSSQWVPYLDGASDTYVPAPTADLAPPVTYSYDPVGRLVSVTDPDGAVTTTAYNDWAVTATDAAGNHTTRVQDAYGRLMRVEEHNGTQLYTTTYEYDGLDNLTRVTDAAGNVTTMTYDSLGRKIAMDDPDMGHWQYGYDAVDNLTTQTDARGAVIDFSYDVLNRVIRKEYSAPPASSIQLPASVQYTFDDTSVPYPLGRLTRVVDGSGTSTFSYDMFGRVTQEVKVIDGTTHTIQRGYDLAGRLETLTYPDGDVAAYTYNTQGGLETVELNSLVAGLWSLVADVDYNAAGQLTQMTYGNGVVTDYTYNPQTLRLSELASQGPGGAVQHFAYQFDALGNVTQITDFVYSASQTFAYDGLSRLTQASGSYGAHSYAYDAIGNMTQKAGVAMTYGQNDAGPHAVTQTDEYVLSYDPNGNLVEKRPVTCDTSPVPCPLSQTLSYDAENRLVEVATSQEASLSVSFEPGWNFFALPVILDDPSVSALFPTFAEDFEQISRFVPASSLEPPASDHFEHYVGNPKFDEFTELEYGRGYQVYCANPAGVTVEFSGQLPAQQWSASLESGWHLLAAPGLASLTPQDAFPGLELGEVQGYDASSGALAPATELLPGQAYWVEVLAASTWTPPLPADPLTRFVYDGDGGRVKEVASGGTRIFLGELVELGPEGPTKHVFAGSQRIAEVRSSVQPPASSIQYYHGDHLGSSHVVTDSSGQVVGVSQYTPYGEPVAHGSTPPAPGPFGFTGQRRDDSTGLYYYHARYYDPELGRFTQPDPFVQDPADPQTLNRYSYVRNNPVNYVDPSGNFFFEIIVAFVIKHIVEFVIAAAGVAIGAAQLEARMKLENQPAPSAPPASQIFLSPPPQPTSQADQKLALNIQGVKQKVTAFSRSEAYRKLVQIGVSPVAAALEVQQQTQANVAAIGKLVTNAIDFAYSFGSNNAYTLKTLTPTADIHGKNFSFVKGALGFSTLEFVSTSPASTGKLSFDKTVINGQFGANFANGGLGGAFELSANVISISTEFNVFSIGGTTFSVASQAGYGGLLKSSLMVDNAKGFVIGGGVGFGRNASLELRFRRQKEP
ncbi:MAG TPA: RHS repeat-associated core domain-containing protein [Nitrospiraceae bacterium]